MLNLRITINYTNYGIAVIRLLRLAGDFDYRISDFPFDYRINNIPFVQKKKIVNNKLYELWNCCYSVASAGRRF